MNTFKRPITNAIVAVVFLTWISFLTSCQTTSNSNSSAGLDSDLDLGSSPLDGENKSPPATTAAQPPVVESAPSEDFLDETPSSAAAAEVAPPPELPNPLAVEEPSGTPANIYSLQYKANENGGTIVIQSDKPVTFSKKMNSSTEQFVVEIQNARLDQKVTRPMIARDIPGPFGMIDAYVDKLTGHPKIVVQMRAGYNEPSLMQDGSALLVMGNSSALTKMAASDSPGSPTAAASEGQKGSLLSSASLEDFLKSNTQFYGKKISIETDDMELRDLFKLISEEAGINFIVSDDIKGKMSLKLRQVPWDQALVLVLKSKKLGYTRSGNILRISPMSEIRQEEDDSVKLANTLKDTEALRVKLIPISYSQVAEVEKQVKPFLSKRGSITSDTRTSAVVISDIQENLDRVLKLVESIDIPPTQILIEGKIIEASEQFEKRFGISWTAGGKTLQLGGAQSITPSPFASVSPGISPGSFGFGFNFGTVDLLGDLNAQLSLFEREGNIKILSSPRIVALHNEQAKITQNVKFPVVTSTPVAGSAPQNSVTYQDAKLEMNVTPQATNAGSVIMGIDVTRDIPTEPDPSTGQRAINGRSAKTKVLIKNGQTAVIGGIFQNDVTEGETRVPVLGSIPVVGWLFKSKTKSVQKNELLIFLTPKLIGDLGPKTIQGSEEL